MSHELPLSVISADQIQSILLELNDYEGQLVETSVKAKVSKVPSAAPTISKELVELLPDKPTNAEFEELKKYLEEVRDSAPVVHIILPGIASATLKQALVHWFRERIDPMVLLDFEVDREIAGGFILEVGGKVYDYSFRQRLLEKKAVIARLYHGR